MMHPAAIDRREAYRNAEAQERRDREGKARLTCTVCGWRPEGKE